MIYYAHPVSIYGTLLEKIDLETIEKVFYYGEIYNPNCKDCEDGYKKEGMEYFKNKVKSSKLLVFRSFTDGKISSGVAKEIEWALEDNIPVIELPTYYDRKLSVEETRVYIKNCGIKK